MVKTTNGLLAQKGISLSAFLDKDRFKRYNVGISLQDIFFSFLKASGKSTVPDSQIKGLDQNIQRAYDEIVEVIKLIRENASEFPDIVKIEDDDKMFEKWLDSQGFINKTHYSKKYQLYKAAKITPSTLKGTMGYFANLRDTLVYTGLVKKDDENWKYLDELAKISEDTKENPKGDKK